MHHNHWEKSSQLAWRVRRNIVKMTHLGNSSHVGSALSMVDILAVLYSDILTYDPKYPEADNRDRFILSKGHAGAGLYATLAECGFFPVEMLDQHYKNGSILSGHVSHNGIPGVEFSTGSLGHGLPVGVGVALSAKKRNETHRVFVILSDGECDEGSNWEAFMFAAHHRLSNLTAVIDYNKLQSLESTHDTLDLEPFADKLTAFGWNVVDIDGHNHNELKNAFGIKSQVIDKPTVVLANTTKGKGVSFMENEVLWHYRSPQGEEYEAAMAELEKSRY